MTAGEEKEKGGYHHITAQTINSLLTSLPLLPLYHLATLLPARARLASLGVIALRVLQGRTLVQGPLSAAFAPPGGTPTATPQLARNVGEENSTLTRQSAELGKCMMTRVTVKSVKRGCIMMLKVRHNAKFARRGRSLQRRVGLNVQTALGESFCQTPPPTRRITIKNQIVLCAGMVRSRLKRDPPTA